MGKLVVAASRDGKSYFVEDKPLSVADFDHVPGFSASVIWASDPAAPHDPSNRAEARKSVLPSKGESQLMVVTFPPQQKLSDPKAAAMEYAVKLPGLAESFEASAPGMHRTDTIDYGIVLDGEIVLELDGEHETLVQAGDYVVQHAGRHAWRNRSGRPATIAFVMIGTG